MLKRFFAPALLLATILGPGGHAEAGNPVWFYRAESPAGKVTFFYPSFHLRDSRVTRPPMSMLDQVGRLVLEADVVKAKAHPERLTPYIIGPRPRDLGALFTSAEIKRIHARADCNGVGPYTDSLRLAFISAIVSMPCPKRDGNSYEEFVEQAAIKRGLDIVGLESGEEELAALNSLPDRLYIADIKEWATQPERLDQTIAEMIVRYNAGDFDGLYEEILTTETVSVADRDLFIQKLLLERNRHMVERLGEVLRDGHALVIIGALHFPRAGGILDLLKHGGYRITRIDGSDGTLR
jgi:hypothetical protein